MEIPLSSPKQNAAIAVVLLGVFATVVTYGYYSSHPSMTQPSPLIENLQLRSTSVDIVGLNRTGFSLRLSAVVYNPNGFGAKLDSANYSVYANGQYVGSGETTRGYDIAAQSSQTFVFPVDVGWKSAFEAAGHYVVGLGHVSWEVKGNADVDVGVLHLSVPFEFTVG